MLLLIGTGSRRIREGRTAGAGRPAAFSATVVFAGFQCLLTQPSLGRKAYFPVSGATSAERNVNVGDVRHFRTIFGAGLVDIMDEGLAIRELMAGFDQRGVQSVECVGNLRIRALVPRPSAVSFRDFAQVDARKFGHLTHGQRADEAVLGWR